MEALGVVKRLADQSGGDVMTGYDEEADLGQGVADPRGDGLQRTWSSGDEVCQVDDWYGTGHCGDFPEIRHVVSSSLSAGSSGRANAERIRPDDA